MGDVKQTVAALLPMLECKSDRSHLDDCVGRYDRAGKSSPATRGIDGRRPIHPESLATAIDEAAGDDAVFTADTGMCCVWAARYLRMRGRRQLIGSFRHGSMANAMPQAIGAQLAFPGRQVVSLSGDGGFSMLMGDFLTIAQYDLPVKTVVFNNGTLGMVKMEMLVAGMPDFGVNLKNPDFARMAEAVGVPGIRVEDPGDLRGRRAGDGDAGAGPAGRGDQPQRAVYAAQGQPAAGVGLQPVDAQGAARRPRRRRLRAGGKQPELIRG